MAESSLSQISLVADCASFEQIREFILNILGSRKKLLKRKVVEQNDTCAICLEEFTDYNDVVPDHKEPKGMGGAWRDDHPDNIQAVHYWCNSEKGSVRLDG